MAADMNIIHICRGKPTKGCKPNTGLLVPGQVVKFQGMTSASRGAAIPPENYDGVAINSQPFPETPAARPL